MGHTRYGRHGRHHERMHHEEMHHEFGPWARHFERAVFGGQWGGGRRARRGDVRAAILTLLADEPMHGYDVIRRLEERSGGRWRPSPGSVYPTLQLLEDEGLIAGEERDGRRVFTLTDAGRVELQDRRERGEGEPWAFGPSGEGFGQLRDAVFQLGAAALQVARTGSEAQRTRTAEVLSEARKKIYALLAED
ncbi:MAG TPA: PadR family transcriptional regulator [Actinomycetota bacterium]|nr:PadR family transcriptional regulator [Actinomycetota bacterium]